MLAVIASVLASWSCARSTAEFARPSSRSLRVRNSAATRDDSEIKPGELDEHVHARGGEHRERDRGDQGCRLYGRQHACSFLRPRGWTGPGGPRLHDLIARFPAGWDRTFNAII